MKTDNKMKTRKKIKVGILMILLVASIFSIFILNFTSAEDVKSCCEKTTYGAWCQEAPIEQCDPGFRNTQTSCEATSFCKLGCCYDSSEGICMENTPERVCEEVNGHWGDSQECEIPQCQLGCCVLGTQAAYVTLSRCKKLSGFYGLQTDYRLEIGDELSCISLASLGDEGACVYEVDFVKTCKYTSRQECNTMKEGMTTANGTLTGNLTFHKDFLCTNEEFATNCVKLDQTTCIEGKDEVYFVDNCGNPGNIYDSSKFDDKDYWTKKVDKVDSCNPNSANINSKTCGNCNYFDGSICKDYKKSNTRPIYGDNICVDLNCKDTSLGQPMRHGESWCSTDNYVDSVGSRYFRHICMNGEEIVEPCSDYRQETCIQDDIAGFSQAGCRVNRWQDCFSQTEKIDCENQDKRDCIWLLGEQEEVETRKQEGEQELQTFSGGTTSIQTEKNVPVEIACVPLHAPGLKFWEEGESQGMCSQANEQCVVSYEQRGYLFPRGEDCIENCECLEDEWKQQKLQTCESIGDCGAKVNFIGVEGNKEGYKFKTKEVNETDSGGGGLFGLSLILNKLGLSGKAVDNQEEE